MLTMNNLVRKFYQIYPNNYVTYCIYCLVKGLAIEMCFGQLGSYLENCES